MEMSKFVTLLNIRENHVMMSNVYQKECSALSYIKIVFLKNLFDLVIRFYWRDDIRILTQRVHTFNILEICVVLLSLNDHYLRQDQRDLEMKYDVINQEKCLINSCNIKKGSVYWNDNINCGHISQLFSVSIFTL